MDKVVVVFGIARACRICEISQVTLDDIEDLGTLLIVKFEETKNYVKRKCVVTEKKIKFYRIYVALRQAAPAGAAKCNNQVVGKNQFYKVPESLANFLQLENANSYIGHSFRRSSATLLVETGGDLMTLKKHGGWKSSTVAEGHVDKSVAHRTEIANKVFRTCGSGEITPDLRPSTSAGVVAAEKHKISTQENSTVPTLRNVSFMRCIFNNSTFDIKEM
ncbi:unnamed protein product [Acanthoscelides obtectus]|uniref:Tyr recombinase domain-containing protein n=1 Tax=Acanthoscelides obtectus TaxID=200917 RepID=A0A9P0MCM0_ACAOB|nr:unnamed protein product [Acanthoscelides obtectus]CAK1635840.1 hypothetical protein AOBTE_LOCUS9552 [Acanthoscelides obtectus]